MLVSVLFIFCRHTLLTGVRLLKMPDTRYIFLIGHTDPRNRSGQCNAMDNRLTLNLDLPGSIIGRNVLRQNTISVTYRLSMMSDIQHSSHFLLSPTTDSPGKKTCRDGLHAPARKEWLV